jgi:hypothetical protein
MAQAPQVCEPLVQAGMQAEESLPAPFLAIHVQPHAEGDSRGGGVRRAFFLHIPTLGFAVESDNRDTKWDITSELAGFAREFPAWCEAGKPKSWEHFIVGIRRIEYQEGRRFLTLARANRVAQAKEDDFRRVMQLEEKFLGLR